jgi:predicted RNA-binding Zn ribbon-like protein
LEVRDVTNDEAFLLDLLNSTPIVDGVQQDLLETARTGRDWLRAHGGSGSTAEWEATRTARSVLQDVVRAKAPASRLEPVLEGVCQRPSISADGVAWTIDVAAPRQLAVRAVLAWDDLRRTSPGRLRPCENPECALFLIDHSKPNKARWCSMAVCGNRMKARRHYERTRKMAAD